MILLEVLAMKVLQPKQYSRNGYGYPGIYGFEDRAQTPPFPQHEQGKALQNEYPC